MIRRRLSHIARCEWLRLRKIRPISVDSRLIILLLQRVSSCQELLEGFLVEQWLAQRAGVQLFQFGES
jgi:hypothetical protein